MKSTIKEIANDHGISVIYTEPGDEYCESNGEESYINSSFIYESDKIQLGIYENQEYKFISFFHELGHMLLPNNFWDKVKCNTLLGELECWRLGIEEAERRGVHFSDDAIEWGYKQALSYSGHDERERLGWYKLTGVNLWKNRKLTKT